MFNPISGERLYEGKRITTKDGLLWREGKIIDLPEADIIANALGFLYVERLVKTMEKEKGE